MYGDITRGTSNSKSVILIMTKEINQCLMSLITYHASICSLAFTFAQISCATRGWRQRTPTLKASLEGFDEAEVAHRTTGLVRAAQTLDCLLSQLGVTV